MYTWTPAERQRNSDAIIRGNAQRAANHGEIRQHEVERVVELARPIFKGTISNGEATAAAIRQVRSGAA